MSDPLTKLVYFKVEKLVLVVVDSCYSVILIIIYISSLIFRKMEARSSKYSLGLGGSDPRKPRNTSYSPCLTVRPTCSQLHRKRFAGFTEENSGDNVAPGFPAGLEPISAFYGCIYAGLVPVCIRPPSSENLMAALPTLRTMMECCNIMAIMTTHSVQKLMTSKVCEAQTYPVSLCTKLY